MTKSKNEFFIIDTVSELYEKQILENYGKILKHISNFINNRSNTLESKNPGLRLLYTPTQENDFYESCGVDKDKMKEICKQSKIVPQDYLVDNPVKQFYHLYFLLQSIASIYYKNNEALVNKYYKNKKEYTPPYKVIEIYFTIRLYSIQQLRFFHHVPREDIMEYTINNLNGRFELSSAPNLFSIFQRYVETNDKSTKALTFDFNRLSDKMMVDYINKMNDRLKMFLKTIYVEYMKNHDANLSSTVQELEATNDEGKQFLLVADNISSTIEITSKKILNTFIQDKFINEKLVKIACKNSGNPSMTKVKQVITAIRDSKDEALLKELIVCVLSYWLVSMKQDVSTLHSKQFIVTCSAAYAISNTSDRYITRLKDVLEELLLKYTANIITTERKATLLSYKKCIHVYMVLYIASVN